MCLLLTRLMICHSTIQWWNPPECQWTRLFKHPECPDHVHSHLIIIQPTKKADDPTFLSEFPSHLSSSLPCTPSPLLFSHTLVQSTCIIQQPPMDTAITCPSPATPSVTTTDTLAISFQLDGLTVTSDDVNQTVTVHQNPTFAPVGTGMLTQQLGNIQDISIEVNPAISKGLCL